jgi:hypothetical protein
MLHHAGSISAVVFSKKASNSFYKSVMYVSNSSETIQNRTHADIIFFNENDLKNHF